MTMGQVCCERIHDLCDERKISLNKVNAEQHHIRQKQESNRFHDQKNL